LAVSGVSWLYPENGRDALRLVDQRIGLERLRGELDVAERLTRSGGDPYLEQLAERAAAIDRLLAAVLQTLEFHVGAGDHVMLDVLRLLRGLDGSGRRWLPGPVPAFVPKAWRGWMFDADRGRVDRRTLTVASAFELRSALRAGRVWLETATATPIPPRTCSRMTAGTPCVATSPRRSGSPNERANGWRSSAPSRTSGYACSTTRSRPRPAPGSAPPGADSAAGRERAWRPRARAGRTAAAPRPRRIA
jgi:hypothetical protein